MRIILFCCCFLAYASTIFGQNVGINTTTPNRPLTIKGTGNSSELISFIKHNGEPIYHLNLKNDGLNFSLTDLDDYVLFLTYGGRVGMGTSAPYGTLHIADQTISREILSLQQLGNYINQVARIGFRFSDQIQNNMSAGFSYLEMVKNEESGSYFAIGLPNAPQAEPIERFRIDYRGWTGIGTKSPECPLHVKNPPITNHLANFESVLPDGYIQLRTTTGAVRFGIAGPHQYISSIANANFSINNEATTRLFINGANGNMAIGTVNATEKLRVAGNGRFDDGLFVSKDENNTLFDYYEATSFEASLFNGLNSLAGGITLNIQRTGRQVTLTVADAVTNLTISGVNEIRLNYSLPQRFRPTGSEVRVPIPVSVNGLWSMGLMLIGTDGRILLRPSATNALATWSGVSNAGIFACSAHYVL